MFRPPTCSKAASPPEKIAGKLVLIGTSAVGLNDIKTTPVDPVHAGRRDPCPGARERADRRRVVRSRTTRIAVELLAALVLGLLVIIVRADVRTGHASLLVGALFASRADRHVLVFLRAAPAI